MQIEGVIIFDANSGLLLFSKIDESVDSSMFSSFVWSIKEFFSELSLGGLSSFTTEEKTIFLASKSSIITAMITTGNPDYKKGYSTAFNISDTFESSYEITESGIADLSKYSGFSSKLDGLLSLVITSFEDHLLSLVITSFEDHSKYTKSLEDPTSPELQEKTIYIYTVNLQGDPIAISFDNKTDLSTYSVLIIANTIIKQISVLENSKDVSSQLLFYANRAADRLNNQYWKSEFQTQHISDPFNCDNLIDQAINLTKECDLNIPQSEPNKIIMMGLSESGKTTIIKVITEGYIPDKKAKYTATLDYERKKFSLMGEKLTIFDLGGQKALLDRFTGELAQFIFSNVKALLFVVDVGDISRMSRAKYYLDLTLKNLNLYSPLAPVYALLHKIDLFTYEKPQEFENFTSDIKTYLTTNLQKKISFFETTVFSDSIFTAFGKIFANISKSHESIERVLNKFIEENSKTVEKIQIFSENWVPLIDNSNFTNISVRNIKNKLITTLQGLTNKKENTKSALMESEEIFYIVKFLNNGTSLLLGIPQENLIKNNENIGNLYNKITLLSEEIDLQK
ncbi:MAG: ADP-ribosylation factor-like protein [Candidatus Hodarchaeales archaeon]